MITKQEFELAASQIKGNLMAVLPQMISYQSMIGKLCRLARNEWQLSGDAQSLYCATMAVATIVKEYDWGTQYLVGNGLWEMALRIQNA